MFILHVLNDGNEWEMVSRKFDTQEAAEKYFHED